MKRRFQYIGAMIPGIIYGVAKEGERTKENYRLALEVFKKMMVNGEKFCLLSDATNSPPIRLDEQKYYISEMPKYIKAQAIVTDAPFSSPLVSTVFKLNLSGFPAMKFATEEEAKEWLIRYL